MVKMSRRRPRARLPQSRDSHITDFFEPKENVPVSATTGVPSDPKEKRRRKVLTDYFPVRRSGRRTEKAMAEDKTKEIERAIALGEDEGLEVATFLGKGRGVVARRNFRRGEFVTEYAGELVDVAEAKRREAFYAADRSTGCYMYYFAFEGRQYCVDATAETGRLGRLINHSRAGNLVTKKTFAVDRPRLLLVAGRDISPGQEVTYDYGDRSKDSLRHHPWLAF